MLCIGRAVYNGVRFARFCRSVGPDPTCYIPFTSPVKTGEILSYLMRIVTKGTWRCRQGSRLVSLVGSVAGSR